ncbi:hypothetical protein P3T73_12185 [Kiritimatiellota bacterium B12222]|nr:hypothetical protein P3T73_12185 [Kiritimatiellota bacterium B12222]
MNEQKKAPRRSEGQNEFDGSKVATKSIVDPVMLTSALNTIIDRLEELQDEIALLNVGNIYKGYLFATGQRKPPEAELLEYAFEDVEGLREHVRNREVEA